jgi:hypothetical protein
MHFSLILALALVAITACKKSAHNDSGDVTSVDVITQKSSKKNRNNSCGIEMHPQQETFTERQKQLLNRTANLKIEGPVDEDDVYGILAAVPDSLHKLFFQKFNGTLELRVDAKKHCLALLNKSRQANGKQSLSTQEEMRLQDLQGCYSTEHGENGELEKAVIYITSSYDVLRNTLLPLFGAFFSEYYIDLWIPAYKKVKNPDKMVLANTDKFVEIRTGLAKAMLKDIEGNGSLVKMYKDFFNLPDELKNASEADLRAFGTYVFSEALDSRHCSKATLDAFRPNEKEKKIAYKNTFEAFKPLNEMFGKAWFEL